MNYSTLDRPLSQEEESQFYGTPLSETAIAIGEEKVCADLELLESFLDQSLPVREQSSFGPITTADLISKFLLNANATDEQLAKAAREFRTRFLSYANEMVEFYALRAMNS